MSLIARIQVGALFFTARFLKAPVPKTFTGAGSRSKVGAWCKERGYKRALVIMDKTVRSLGIADRMLKSLDAEGIGYVIYDGVLPNPTVGMSREASELGRKNDVNVVIAVGGGSPIDCAKLTAAAITNNKPVEKLVGFFKVKRRPLPIIAIPTTAGTGSEVSVGAVISDDTSHKKSIMLTPTIIPKLAVLDGETMVGLPPQWTAATVFDALTHATEAYISRHFDAEAAKNAMDAIVAINRYLPVAYKHGKNIEARDALAMAAFKAGLAMNKCSLGYAHALGHRLTGFYDLPHGMAVGMMLPHVLEYNRKASEKELAELAVACGLGKPSESRARLADSFVKRVFELYREVKLPEKYEKLKRSDYDAIIKEGFKEANATYAVPKYLTKKEASALLDKLLP